MTGHNAAAASYQDPQRVAEISGSFRLAARCSSGLTNSAVLLRLDPLMGWGFGGLTDGNLDLR